MKWTFTLGSCVFAAALVVGAEASAWACGGCFAPASETSSVTAHRMAFSVSAERTVLWDQFSYDGNPQDFSWVLPVQPGAFVEEAHEAWLDALDEFTSARIYGRALSCGGGGRDGFGCGCYSTDEASGPDAGGFFAPNNSVQVVSQSTVGPYETVVLRSTSQDALTRWLTQNSYIVPPGIDVIIAAYVDEGYDFLALRLSPGKDVQQMTPVRVVTPGGEPMLPLRMVAAGIANDVDITLFLLGNSRLNIPDLEEATISAQELVFDYSSNTSNYSDVLSSKLSQNDGHMQVATFASPRPFLKVLYPPGTPGNPSGTFPIALSEGAFGLDPLYFLRAGRDDGRFAEGQNCAQSDNRPHDSSILVKPRCGDAPCDMQAPPSPAPATGGAGQGGAGQLGGASGTPAPGGQAGEDDPAPEDDLSWSGNFECGGWSDLEAAMIGHRPDSLWLTRLDMSLPRSALERDCTIASASSQASISSVIQAEGVANAPCPVLASSGADVGSGLKQLPIWALALLLLSGGILRRSLRPNS